MGGTPGWVSGQSVGRTAGLEDRLEREVEAALGLPSPPDAADEADAPRGSWERPMGHGHAISAAAAWVSASPAAAATRRSNSDPCSPMPGVPGHVVAAVKLLGSRPGSARNSVIENHPIPDYSKMESTVPGHVVLGN